MCLYFICTFFIFDLSVFVPRAYLCKSGFLDAVIQSIFSLSSCLCECTLSPPPQKKKKASSAMSYSITHQNRSQARACALQLGNRVRKHIAGLQIWFFLPFCQMCQEPYGVWLVSHTCSVHESQKKTYFSKLTQYHRGPNLGFLKTMSLSDFWVSWGLTVHFTAWLPSHSDSLTFSTIYSS